MITLPDLPPTYYHSNFQQLIDQAQRLYADLLSKQEQQWLMAYQRLSLPAQCLYVRLLSRKGTWFRLEKLHYDEIPELPQAAQQLADAGFIRYWHSSELDAEQIPNTVALFTKAELGQRLNISGWRSLSRVDLQQAAALLLPERCAQLVLEPLLEVTSQAFMELLQLLFFGQLQQSLTEFVLSDLGIYRYEAYSLEAEQRLFNQRQHIEAHLQFERWRQQLPEIKSLSATQLIEQLQALPAATDATMARRIERLRLTMARQLERLGEHELAVQHYGLCQRHPARERQLRILQRQQSPERLQLAAEMLANPWSEEERQFCQQFIPRMKCPQLEVPNVAPPEQVLLLADSDEQSVWQQQGVEQAALHAWQREHGGRGYYVENHLLTSVFGLTFWPVIFASVSGAFFHPFQHRPADLYETDFLSRRQGEYDACQQQWQRGTDAWLALLEQRWQQKNGIANPLVHWPALEWLWPEALPQALATIPPAHWQAMFDFVWRDVRRHRSGMPDLIWFDDQGGYQWLEVKGPGDSLQGNQRAWFQCFARHGIHAQVLQLRSS
ncbi:nuclease [Bacterioplanes sanyensis]|uniref:VRR-NUC domain-containing protein n=1 Tax=Bacterioplanes sanyensis TaxID=1249553 RepID=UPI0016742DD5|nr:VRR-NUC domain-containing protein [Bacterioplanes sanyensis]GGY45739.1 nuclease [Bacterioplanes sanyensis]